MRTAAILPALVLCVCGNARSAAPVQDTVACVSSGAMARWMAAPADTRGHAQEARLLAGRSCFHLPADWTVTALSENSRPGRPVALTLRTPDGERHLWGIPIDEH